MKSFFVITLFLLVSCSSDKPSKHPAPPKNLSSQSFKKGNVFQPREVKDYIVDKPKTFNPALHDETLDRYSVDEIATMAESTDPLVILSLKCTKRDFKEAFSLANKLYHNYQKIPAYWNLVANCHLQQGSDRKAMLFYNKAIELSPGYVAALNNIGVLYARQGDDQKALVAFEKANSQSRFSKTPRYNLARLYLKYGMAELALPIYQGLLNEAPDDAELLNAVGTSHFILSDYSKAIMYFKRIPAQLIANAEFGLNYSVALKKIGQRDEAIQLFKPIRPPKRNDFKDYYLSVSKQLGVSL